MSNVNKPPGDEQQVERYIGTLLSKQPLRQAPSTLETRVLRELALRASKPWWLQGFSRWPWAARALFLPLGVGLVQLSFVATARLMALACMRVIVWNCRTGARVRDFLGQCAALSPDGKHIACGGYVITAPSGSTSFRAGSCSAKCEANRNASSR